MTKVVKRDDTTEEFKWEKVYGAVYKAVEETNTQEEDLEEITQDIVYNMDIGEFFEHGEEHISVENIQDSIEDSMIDLGLKETAKSFIRYRHDRAKRRAEGWKLDDLQQSIWEHKYQQLGESFEEWLDRVSGGNAKVKRLIEHKKFLFAGRILSNRGMDRHGRKVTLSNCYVLPEPEDNLEDIYKIDYEMARTFSYGGGVGTGIGKLRPKGATVKNSAKTTSGAVSFMDQFDATTGRIGQNGRRGALMITLDCSHPDIQEFLDIKAVNGAINHANISIKVTDDFMKSVIHDEDYLLKWEGEHETIQRVVRARDIFSHNARNNWDWAEAGMLYWDTVENNHLMSAHPEHKFAGVNPCGEEPLMAYGSCLLGALNLSEFVVHPFTDKAYFDYVKFAEAVHIAVEGLNEVLDEGLEMHPLQQQRDNARDWRQIGLGVMGFADMLVKLKIPYSEKAGDISFKISNFMLNESLRASAQLSKIHTPFPKFDLTSLQQSEFYQTRVRPEIKYLIEQNGLRNSQITTIAPTGSTSTMLGVSGGMEPIFAKSYKRKTQSLHGEDRYYNVYTPIVKEAMEHECTSTPPLYIKTSHEVKWEDRVNIQGQWQYSIDASISSTVNLPKTATVEDVEELFIKSWEMGLKGVTIFRDGCKRAGILTVDDPEEPEEEVEDGKMKCSECGEIIEVVSNGCTVCMNCGHSPCS